MAPIKPDYWFPAKRFGWGWGPPVRIEGWLVLLAYFAIVVLGIPMLDAPRHPAIYFGCALVATIVLIAICAWKGERPLKWRWGKDRE